MNAAIGSTNIKQMHYNHFTINYINAIKSNLRIEINSNGEATFFPEFITLDDIKNLKTELEQIWSSSETSISIVKERYDATIQSGLFGLVNDFDMALKVGYLLGDRVILIDYLFERILSKKAAEDIDVTHLGVLSVSLVNALSLAESGRLVIIPNPFNWYPKSKKIIKEVSDKTMLNPNLMSLLNMLSITKECKLHPFTIAENQKYYSTIIDNQLDLSVSIGFDNGQYAYKGILGALLTERLLQETELRYVLNIPLSRYAEIISSNKDFYNTFLSSLTTGGSLSADENMEHMRKSIIEAIDKRERETMTSVAKGAGLYGNISAGVIGVLGVTTVISSPIAMTVGALLGLTSTLTGLLSSEKSNNPIISVFNKLLP